MNKAIECFDYLESILKLEYKDFFNRECKTVKNELIYAKAAKVFMSKWLELLETDGINSKKEVADGIRFFLDEEVKEDE